MITDKRKTEIIDNFLSWMIEHHNNDEDLYFTLKNVIGMTKEELNEFSIESLDEYYEKEQEKAEEETLETITAEDLVEQAVYLANAPDGATAEDKSEAMLGMLGANIVDESVYEEPDYEKEVEESIVKEFADFKSERTEGKTSEQVFEDAYEIHVKTELKNGICEEYLTAEVYKALYQKKGGILQALYDAYQEDPNASVTTNTDAREFVEKYCEQNFPKIMNGDEPALSMGDSMEKEIDYKHEVIDSVDQEFKAYEAELLKGTTENVFCHSYETSVKTEFREAICGEVEFDDNVYKALYQEKGKILENLHQDFIGQSHASVNSFEETGIFVEDYCNRYHKEIMNEQDEAPQMGMG